MAIEIRQDPAEYGVLNPAHGKPFVWAVLGDDVRVPVANGRAATYEDAMAAAESAAVGGEQWRWRTAEAVYPVPGGKWRWCIWRGTRHSMKPRPIFGGVCDTASDAEKMTFFAIYHTHRTWEDYERAYRGDFAGGELLDPLVVEEVAHV